MFRREQKAAHIYQDVLKNAIIFTEVFCTISWLEKKNI